VSSKGVSAGKPARSTKRPTAFRHRATGLERDARWAPVDGREYPLHPRVGVGGVVIRGDNVVLVRRARPPLKGRWSLPGGLVELGEELAEAAKREIKEETGLDTKPLEVVGVFERVLRQAGRKSGSHEVHYHYVLVDFLCEVRSESQLRTLRPASDVSEARWVAIAELGKYRLEGAAKRLILNVFKAAAPG
jgi:8-oxo-dGTP diphosphatase